MDSSTVLAALYMSVDLDLGAFGGQHPAKGTCVHRGLPCSGTCLYKSMPIYDLVATKDPAHLLTSNPESYDL